MSDSECSEKLVQKSAWCFTWNNYPPNWEELFRGVFGPKDIRYLLYAPEVAPSTGTPHIQGYVQFHRKKAMIAKKWKKTPIRPVSFRAANGTWEENLAYIKGPYLDKKTGKQKPLNPAAVESGTPVNQGTRSDLYSMGSSLLAGEMSVSQACYTNPDLMIRYGRCVDRFLNMAAGPRDFGCTVVHSSSLMEAFYRPEGVYLAVAGKWDDYEYQPVSVVRKDDWKVPDGVVSIPAPFRVGDKHFRSRILVVCESRESMSFDKLSSKLDEFLKKIK